MNTNHENPIIAETLSAYAEIILEGDDPVDRERILIAALENVERMTRHKAATICNQAQNDIYHMHHKRED